jgi:hypothetical protein
MVRDGVRKCQEAERIPYLPLTSQMCDGTRKFGPLRRSADAQAPKATTAPTPTAKPQSPKEPKQPQRNEKPTSHRE